MKRRKALKMGLTFAASGAMPGAGFLDAVAVEKSAWTTGSILDGHIHLFDTARSGGVPWPLPSDAVLYKPALPARYQQVCEGLGVVGAIAIEASPLEGDNDWVLRQVEANPILVGMVGNLTPGSRGFAVALERLRRSPYFLGIRYGNLWGRDLFVDRSKPGFMDDVGRLAEAGLVFESANPDGRLIEALLDISQQAPELRMVIDHLPNATVPVEELERKRFWGHLRELGRNARVYVKLSEVPVVEGGRLKADGDFYREKLDPLWEVFGEDRVLFGSDWPNSDSVAGYRETLGIVRKYVAGKGAGAGRKYFFDNSVAAYRWKPRRAEQRLT